MGREQRRQPGSSSARTTALRPAGATRATPHKPRSVHIAPQPPAAAAARGQSRGGRGGAGPRLERGWRRTPPCPVRAGHPIPHRYAKDDREPRAGRGVAGRGPREEEEATVVEFVTPLRVPSHTWRVHATLEREQPVACVRSQTFAGGGWRRHTRCLPACRSGVRMCAGVAGAGVALTAGARAAARAQRPSRLAPTDDLDGRRRRVESGRRRGRHCRHPAPPRPIDG